MNKKVILGISLVAIVGVLLLVNFYEPSANLFKNKSLKRHDLISFDLGDKNKEGKLCKDVCTKAKNQVCGKNWYKSYYCCKAETCQSHSKWGYDYKQCTESNRIDVGC